MSFLTNLSCPLLSAPSTWIKSPLNLIVMNITDLAWSTLINFLILYRHVASYSLTSSAFDFCLQFFLIATPFFFGILIPAALIFLGMFLDCSKIYYKVCLWPSQHLSKNLWCPPLVDLCMFLHSHIFNKFSSLKTKTGCKKTKIPSLKLLQIRGLHSLLNFFVKQLNWGSGQVLAIQSCELVKNKIGQMAWHLETGINGQDKIASLTCCIYCNVNLIISLCKV